MKIGGILLLVIGLFRPVTCLSQVYVDGTPIDTVNTPYCQLICSNSGLMTKASVMIDYGQRYVNTGLNRQKIAGSDRQPITFNSTIHALNFMVKNGWELVSYKVIGTQAGAESTFIYMLHRQRRFKQITD